MEIIRTIQSRKTNNVFLEDVSNVKFRKDDKILSNFIRINSKIKYQTIIGFGGAFTEASAHVLATLPKEKQQQIIKSYFGKDGNAFNLGRVHINSCDFGLGNYTYVEDGDLDLHTFNIKHDTKEIIPMIKMAYKESKDMKLLASPWSPPAYMKTNNNMNYGGKLLKEYYDLWSRYIIKYLDEMEKQGIHISMLTVQNEPLATQTWDSCIYLPEDERDFIKDYMGPALLNSHKDVDLYIWDHNRGDVLVDYATRILDDKRANKYVKGLAFHWYVSEDFASLSKFHEMYPDKTLLFTEGCVEFGYKGGYDEAKAFDNGIRYAHHMINDFNNFSTGFIDWNLILDENGGPNHVFNNCEAPVMVTHDGKIIYNPSYYFIGHFSRFVKKGARRVQTVTVSNNQVLEAVSFENPDGSLVINVLNRGWIEETSLIIDGHIVNVVLPNQSITTLIIDLKGR